MTIFIEYKHVFQQFEGNIKVCFITLTHFLNEYENKDKVILKHFKQLDYTGVQGTLLIPMDVVQIF